VNEPACVPGGAQPLSPLTSEPAAISPQPAQRPAHPFSQPVPGVLGGVDAADAGVASGGVGAEGRPGLLTRAVRRLLGRGSGGSVLTNEAGDVVLPKNAKLERLPHIPGQPANAAYALVTSGLPLPPGGAGYVVEARHEQPNAASAAVTPGTAVQVVGYVDGFGRAFSVGSVQSMPPAREPELQFMHYTDRAPHTGCVEASASHGKTVRLAEYVEKPAGTFTVVSPRVDLGLAATACPLRIACAVAFLAFWLFPRKAGISLSTLSVRDALGHLRTNDLFEAIGALLADARQAEGHPLLTPPGVLAYMAYNLRHAGLEGVEPIDFAASPEQGAMPAFPQFPVAPGLSIAGLPVPGIAAPGPMGGGSGVDMVAFMRRALEAAGITGLSVLGAAGLGQGGAPTIRFIRTSGYANTLYVGFDRAQVSPEGARKLLEAESLLNRFVFIVEELDRVGLVQTAGFGQVAQLDSWIVDTVAQRAWPYLDGQVEGAASGSSGSVGLDVRMAFARGCEKLRMPYRLEYGFRFDASCGELVVDVEMPSSELMPRLLWQPGAEAWRERTYAEREGMATRYALHVLVTVAAVALWSHEAVRRVTVNGWHGMGASAGVDELARFDNGTVRGPVMCEPACVASASFARDELTSALATAAQRDDFVRDPVDLLTRFGAIELDADWHLCRVQPLRSLDDPALHPGDSNMPPELDERLLDERGSALLRARMVRDLGIFEDGPRKSMADEIVRAFDQGGAEAAMAAAMDVHDRTENPLVREAVLGVRDRISAGTYAANSQARIMESLSDIYGLQAGMKSAHRLVKTDPAAACEELQSLIDTCDEHLWFADTSTRKYRYFDSYASRVVYAMRHPEAEDGRELRLCPDEYYLCHYRLASVMADSLDYAEEAIVHARRCVELAPTVAASHLRLARCYFSVFDYVSEIEAIKGMLRVAWNPADLGMAFYWLGYAYCMVDKHEVGMACYQQAAMIDPSVTEAAAAELTDLLRKRGEKPRKLSEAELESLLNSEGIDLTWIEANIYALIEAAGAAVDVEAYGLARNLLNAAQVMMHDDALPPVLESLEE